MDREAASKLRELKAPFFKLSTHERDTTTHQRRSRQPQHVLAGRIGQVLQDEESRPVRQCRGSRQSGRLCAGKNLFRQTQKENHHGSRGRGRRCRACRPLQKAHHTHKLEITLNKNLAL